MRALLFLTAFLSLMSGVMPASASEGCGAITLSHEQCQFDVPSLNEGGVTSVLSEGLHFEGQSTAICKNGVASLVKPSCDVVEKTDCKVDETSWIKSGAMCSHGRQAKPMTDGSILTLNDVGGQGSITYVCEAGNLRKTASTCTSSDVVKIGAQANAQQLNVTAQSTQTATVDVPFMVSEEYTEEEAKNSVRVRTAAESACLSVDDYIAGSAPNVVHYGQSEQGNTFFVAECGVSTELRCDQGIVNALVPGRYDPQRGEYTLPPNTTSYNMACEGRGYGHSDKLIVLNREHMASDTFMAGLLCAGRQSSCNTVGPGQGALIEFTSCDTAKIRTGLIEVNKGENPTNSDYIAQCQNLQFDNLEQVIAGPHMQDQSGQFDYYDATVSCGTYTGSTSDPSYPSECEEDGGAAPPPPSVTPLTCDTARVKGYVSAERDPQTGRYDKMPGDSTVSNALCGASGYTTLDSMDDSTFYQNSQEFYVTASCSGNTNEDRASCEAKGPCYGEELTLPTEEPYLELGGKYYFNKCYTKPPPPSFLCEDCGVEPFSFTDTNNGNTCTVNSRNMKSGDEYSFTFADTTQNGRVEALCNNGKTRATGGECYQSCPGGVYVGWDDKNGAESCSQRVPNGVYKHNQRITLGSSVDNTGSATLRCDGNTGDWIVESGQCKLDCTSTASWGSGFSNNSVNKNGLCRATPGRVSHNDSGTIYTSTPGTTGRTGYQCDDGQLKLNSSSCDVECAPENKSWGNYCSASIPAQESGARSTFLHGSRSVNAQSQAVELNSLAMSATAREYRWVGMASQRSPTRPPLKKAREMDRCDPSAGDATAYDVVDFNYYDGWYEYTVLSCEEVNTGGGNGCSWSENTTLAPGFDGWNAKNHKNCRAISAMESCSSSLATPGGECYETRSVNDRYCSATIREAVCSGGSGGDEENSAPPPPPPSETYDPLPPGPFPGTASGSITLSCDDGVRRSSNASCKYGVRYERKNWSSWKVESSSTTKTPTDQQIEDSPGSYTEQVITTTYQEYRTRRVVMVWSDGSETFEKNEREERERTETETNALPPPMNDLMAGCFVDTPRYDTPAYRCSASVAGTTYSVTFVVGDSTSSRGDYIMQNPSQWEYEWVGDCTGTSRMCTVNGSLPARYVEERLTAGLTVTHKATGQTEVFSIRATVMSGMQ